MPFQTLNTFTRRLYEDVTQTTPLPYDVLLRGNVRAAQGFEDEKLNPDIHHIWSTYVLPMPSQNDSDIKKAVSHPDPKRYLYFWTWPYLIVRGIRASLMNAVNHMASNSSVGLQSESPAWAKGLKLVVASLLYPVEILSYLVAKIPDAVAGKVNNTRSRIGLICTGLAIAAAVTACVLFPPAIPVILFAAKWSVAASFVSAAASAVYTLGAGVVNGFKKLFCKTETKKDAPIMANDPSPVKKKPIKQDLAKIQRAIPSPKSAKAPQLPQSPKAVRSDASHRNMPVDHPVDRIKSILNEEEVSEVKFHQDQPVPPINRTEVIPSDNTVVQFHVDPSETPRP